MELSIIPKYMSRTKDRELLGDDPNARRIFLPAG